MAQEWGAIGPGIAKQVRITDGGDCHASLTNFGARLVGLTVPDRQGRQADIVLGHDSPAEYAAPASSYTGATCGRHANRISGAGFTLDGQHSVLDHNEGGNHLHGGADGFHAKLWRIAEMTGSKAHFTMISPEDDMGYPGALTASVIYEFSGPLRLEITLTARVSGAPTVCNLVHHSYFNPAGEGSGPVDALHLRITADHYLPVGAGLIPTGEQAPVAGTAFDFRRVRRLDAAIPPGGFDHNLCLPATTDPQIELRDPVSGRGFTLWTNQPGVQLYTAGHLPEGLPGKAGVRLGPRAGVALETQGWPDSPNQPSFPSTRLNPGETYRHRMVFDLSPDAGAGGAAV